MLFLEMNFFVNYYLRSHDRNVCVVFFMTKTKQKTARKIDSSSLFPGFVHLLYLCSFNQDFVSANLDHRMLSVNERRLASWIDQY